MKLIEVKDLSKTFRISKRETGLKGALHGLFKREYEYKHALDHISFSIDEGELIGYIGPNGAGKSTTIKILTGILYPNGGRCIVNNRIPWEERREHVKDIGVVFGQRTQLWWDLPVIESFNLLRDMYRLEDGRYQRKRDDLVELFQIGELLNTPVRQLSLGQKMKCELTASLLHDPKILFLDEPTIGLDAPSKLVIREHIRQINKEKKVTVILTTHVLDDIEVLCNRILILNNGKIIKDGSLNQIADHIKQERKILLELMDENLKLNIPNVGIVQQEGAKMTLSYDASKVNISDLLKQIVNEYPIKEIFIESPKIEEVIARIYKE